MTRNRGAAFVFFLIVVIAFLHFAALEFYLYWSIWWFDVMMHFLGGAWVTSVVLWLVFYSNFFQTKGRPVSWALFATFIVGVLWEIYEYSFGIAMVPHETYAFDTVLDLIMDMSGALVALPLFVSKRVNNVCI